MQIEFNLGYDNAEVVTGYQTLIGLCQKSEAVESFIVSDHGAVERYVLSGLYSRDKQVKLYSCKCLQSLLKGGKNRKINIWNQKVQDIVVKKWGVHALKSCVLDEVIDIRKTGLDILSHLCR